MTADAVKAEFPVVYVIGPVAITTATPKLAQRRQRLAVAVVARDRDMRAIQNEI